MDKNSIAEILNKIGILLELKGENAFRVRAYQSGARALESLNETLSDVIQEERLTSIKGIGRALGQKIETLHRTGSLEYYEQLKASIPDGLIEMLEISGMGSKKIRALHASLGIESVSDLEEVCKKSKVADLPGFGIKSQEKILSGIRNHRAYSRRSIWWDAKAAADPILEGLRSLPEVAKAEHAGSLRRGCETVGDLDFLAASEKPAAVIDWFVAQERVAEVTAKGETKSSVRMEGGMQADLRVVAEDQFYFTLHHFTGSKEHNVGMRQRALSQGYSLSEWGITRTEGKTERRVRIQSEAELFGLLSLQEIPPELREGLGEIEAAEKYGLPRLIEEADLKGAFHNHTTASDGHGTLEEMAYAAEAFGWEYIGIADHSKASFQANGLDEGRLLDQAQEIRRINESGRFGLMVLSGVECDILPSGDLDLERSVLEGLDYVVVSAHSAFSQSEQEMTARIIRAIEHPCTTMVGHLTGRILLRREGYRVNQEKVIDAAIANGKIIELNANPCRLDMDWRLWKRAAAKGLLCAINPDAHSPTGLEYYRAGVMAARKGWLAAEQVINTRGREEVRAFLDNG